MRVRLPKFLLIIRQQQVHITTIKIILVNSEYSLVLIIFAVETLAGWWDYEAEHYTLPIGLRGYVYNRQKNTPPTEATKTISWQYIENFDIRFKDTILYIDFHISIAVHYGWVDNVDYQLIHTQWRSNGLFSMCKEQGPTSLRGPLGLNYYF